MTASWREKVPPEVADYIDKYRESHNPIDQLTSILAILVSSDSDPAAKMSALEVLAATAEKWQANFNPPPSADTGEQKTVSLSRDDVDRLAAMGWNSVYGLKEGENVLPAGIAETIEVIRVLASFLEDPEQRTGVYFLIAVLYKIAKGLFLGLRFQEFGVDPLDAEKKRALAAMSLEFFAGLCRGKFDPPKGQLNTELIDLVNLIQDSSNEALTPKELHEAIFVAGLAVGDSENFRVWLHRAKKKGLIGQNRRNTSTPNSQTTLEIPLTADGRVDFDAMSPAEKSALRRFILLNPTVTNG